VNAFDLEAFTHLKGRGMIPEPERFSHLSEPNRGFSALMVREHPPISPFPAIKLPKISMPSFTGRQYICWQVWRQGPFKDERSARKIRARPSWPGNEEKNEQDLFFDNMGSFIDHFAFCQ
jgi:hypothetical protein